MDRSETKKRGCGKNDPTAGKEVQLCLWQMKDPIFPRQDITRQTVTPPPKPYGFVMSHQQENRCILPSPILFVGNSVPCREEKRKQNRAAKAARVQNEGRFSLSF